MSQVSLQLLTFYLIFFFLLLDLDGRKHRKARLMSLGNKDPFISTFKLQKVRALLHQLRSQHAVNNSARIHTVFFYAKICEIFNPILYIQHF